MYCAELYVPLVEWSVKHGARSSRKFTSTEYILCTYILHNVRAYGVLRVACWILSLGDLVMGCLLLMLYWIVEGYYYGPSGCWGDMCLVVSSTPYVWQVS